MSTANQRDRSDPFVRYGVVSWLVAVLSGVAAVVVAGVSSFMLLWAAGSAVGVVALLLLCVGRHFTHG
jgi:hypothetical protein